MFDAFIVLGLTVTCCIPLQPKRWFLPLWLFLLTATGLHILLSVVLLVIAMNGDGWLGMSVVFLLMFSWPVPLTFLALLVLRPCPTREPETP